MNSKRKSELSAVLDDVLPTSGYACGPSLSTVLGIAAHQRRRRERNRLAAAGAAIVSIVIVGTILWRSPNTDLPVVVDSPPAPEPVIIRQIDDDELMALLAGTPAALMEWPNGERTLMVIEP